MIDRLAWRNFTEARREAVSQAHVTARRLPPLLLVALVLACADRTTVSTDDEGETEAPAPGEPFSGCLSEDDCFDDWCVRPAGEPGFCTYACAGGTQNCEGLAGGTATLTCLPVEGQEVCALDCAGNKTCPAGMRCEQVEAGGEARSICF